MLHNIKINTLACTSCSRCVRVCPADILAMGDNKKATTSNTENCIGCGHCVDVCATDAIEHSLFSKEKIHPIDYSQMASSEQIMLLLKARRSNRAFSATPIPSDYLNLILEAAHLAPTATNSQKVEFTLITNPQKLRFISQFTLDTFSAVVKKLENPILKPILKRIIGDSVYRYVPKFKQMAEEYATGNDMILRKATAVIFFHTPESNRFGSADCNLAYQNGSLLAESLGVSQFYTGFVCTAIAQDKSNKLRNALGIKGKIHAGMALAMPSFKFKNYTDREEIKVNII